MSPSTDTPRARRAFTPEQKATILRRHLAERVPVSDRCDEYSLQPSLFDLWQRQALAHLTAALQDGRTQRHQAQAVHAAQARIAHVEATRQREDALLAERSAEYVSLPNARGEA
jgi:transposase